MNITTESVMEALNKARKAVKPVAKASPWIVDAALLALDAATGNLPNDWKEAGNYAMEFIDPGFIELERFGLIRDAIKNKSKYRLENFTDEEIDSMFTAMTPQEVMALKGFQTASSGSQINGAGIEELPFEKYAKTTDTMSDPSVMQDIYLGNWRAAADKLFDEDASFFSGGWREADSTLEQIEFLNDISRDTAEAGLNIISKENDPWEYYKDGDNYYTRKKGTNDWIQTSGASKNSIKESVFGEPPKAYTGMKLEDDPIEKEIEDAINGSGDYMSRGTLGGNGTGYSTQGVTDGNNQYGITGVKGYIPDYSNNNWMKDLAAISLGMAPGIGAMIMGNNVGDLADKYRIDPVEADLRVGTVKDLPKPNFALPYQEATGTDMYTNQNRQFQQANQIKNEQAWETQNAMSKLQQEQAINDMFNKGEMFNAQQANQANALNSQFGMNAEMLGKREILDGMTALGNTAYKGLNQAFGNADAKQLERAKYLIEHGTAAEQAIGQSILKKMAGKNNLSPIEKMWADMAKDEVWRNKQPGYGG